MDVRKHKHCGNFGMIFISKKYILKVKYLNKQAVIFIEASCMNMIDLVLGEKLLPSRQIDVWRIVLSQ